MNRFTRIAALAGATLALATAAPVQAQQAAGFPDHSIKMIIPATPGGGTDFIGRIISQKLGETAKWTVVPENRAGASNTLGMTEVARSKPDGYELMIGQAVNVSVAPWLIKLSMDPIKDLTPISSAVEAPMVLCVAPDSPFKTWDDLVKYAKAHPDKPINYATSGNGSIAQLAGIRIQEISGFKMEHVAYKGSTPALQDLMGGHTDLAGTSVTSALSLLQGGKVRALVVTSSKRSAAIPDVPALSELGYGADFNFVEWYGVFGPAGMPDAVTDKLHQEINKVLSLPDVKKQIEGQGQDVKVVDRAAFAKMVKADNERTRDLIQKAGIKLE